MENGRDDCDALLIFPPQWSPFQPPLGLPSLKAWLERAGFTCCIDDLNVRLYDWLLSDESVEILKERLCSADFPLEVADAYALVLESAFEYRSNVCRMRPNDDSRSAEMMRDDVYIGVKSLQAFLRLISELEPRFDISPYGFSLKGDNYSVNAIEQFIADPPEIIKKFLDRELYRLSAVKTNVIGLSCIGQEQLIFSLLIGARIKKLASTPVIVGGTIFSRMLNRGVLPPEWFGRFFDVVVNNEGEKPLEQIVRLLRASDRQPAWEAIESVAFVRNGTIVKTSPSAPLKSTEMPVGNFDGLPLRSYLSPEIVLPLLSARGCYWGKCEFCHHGMVYGEKYSAYEKNQVLETVRQLSNKYGCNAFSFNDEAIPPKVFRQISEDFPLHANSSWVFTGLIKFEKYFRHSDFQNAFKIGFRTLYVGLESASERVLQLMKKNSTQEIMLENLRDAASAGIWMHCFAFFGFPGEQEFDAEVTYNFLIDNRQVIGSVGCGTFSLEHDAPIQKSHRYKSFGIKILNASHDSVNVYYEYDVEDGIDAVRAKEWSRKLNATLFSKEHFASVSWIPREHLLPLLRHTTSAGLRRWGSSLLKTYNVPGSRTLSQLVGHRELLGGLLIVSRLNMRVTLLTGRARDAAKLLLESAATIGEVADVAQALLHELFKDDEDAELHVL